MLMHINPGLVMCWSAIPDFVPERALLVFSALSTKARRTSRGALVAGDRSLSLLSRSGGLAEISIKLQIIFYRRRNHCHVLSAECP